MSGDGDNISQKRMMVDLKRLSKSHYQIRVSCFFFVCLFWLLLFSGFFV